MYQTINAWITCDKMTRREEVDPEGRWEEDGYGPKLVEEVDEQEWQVHQLLGVPLGEINRPTPLTCDRKAVRGLERCASSWGPADYAEMSWGIAPEPLEGGPVLPIALVEARINEHMVLASSFSLSVVRPDPWDLRGDRVVVPEIILQMADDEEEGRLAMTALGMVSGLVEEMLGPADLVEPKLEWCRWCGAPGPFPRGACYNCGRTLAEKLDVEILQSGDAGRRRGGTTADEDEEEDEKEEKKPLVYKKPEPKPVFHRDEWGFPLTPSEEEPAPKELDASKSTYTSVEPELRESMIQERGMRTRVQLTGYLDGKYVKGEADNFIVPDIGAAQVRTALALIAEIAKAAVVGIKGGKRVRIQLTEYASKGGEYLKQVSNGDAPQNLSILGMTVSQVAVLVDHQLALGFGVRRGDPVSLVKAWRAFVGKGPEDPKKEAPVADGGLPAVGDADLLGTLYGSRHRGKAVVVTHRMIVRSLWATEREAILEARRTGCRVIDREGWLVSQRTMDVMEALDRPQVEA